MSPTKKSKFISINVYRDTRRRLESAKMCPTETIDYLLNRMMDNIGIKRVDYE